MIDLEWKDEYLLGIPEIDRQHKGICDCAKAIEEGLAKHDVWLADTSTVELLSLIQHHNALEESLMRILGYPELERHIEEHRRIQADVHDLVKNSLRVKGSLTSALLKTIQEWQREHIMTSDKHYADYFSRLASNKVA
jgi:hemerythrin